MSKIFTFISSVLFKVSDLLINEEKLFVVLSIDIKGISSAYGRDITLFCMFNFSVIAEQTEYPKRKLSNSVVLKFLGLGPTL